MNNKEQYEEILRGLRKIGFLRNTDKYNVLQQEILRTMNEQELKKLKREYNKLKKKHLKTEKDYNRFLNFVISSSSHP